MDGYAIMRQLLHVLMILLPIGTGVRVAICLIQINSDPEQEATYRRRIRNVLIFFILAQTLLGLLAIVEDYFPGAF